VQFDAIVPTVSDRIAQEVVKRYLEPIVEPIFHKDSYGYRPNRSAIDAIRTARQRCWRQDWVLDIDVRGYFDSIDWELLLKAVRKQTDCAWVLLYIERWLKAPVQMEDGSVVPRVAGTPQGGVISPTLANLFLHYAFDEWMTRSYPIIPFERYADDIICHCRSEDEARALWSALEVRFTACRLVLHPQKTKLIYCKDANRHKDYLNQSFDFLGYRFQPRSAMWRGSQHGVSFLPAASPKALKAIRQTIRRWKLHGRSDKSLEDLAREFNPIIQGWINYYGHFYKSILVDTLYRIDAFLIRWAHNKYKRLRRRPKGLGTGLRELFARTRVSLLTGACCMAMAEHREPYESRGSRTCLGARGGEIPPRDSPGKAPEEGASARERSHRAAANTNDITARRREDAARDCGADRGILEHSEPRAYGV